MTRQEIEPQYRGLYVSATTPLTRNRLRTLMLGLLASAAFIPASVAVADDAQTEKLQRQVDQQQQQQLQTFQKDVAAAKRQAAAVPTNAYAADMPFVKALPGVKVTLGGFIEAAAIWRQRNEVSDVSDPGFASLPFSNSPLWNENETRFSARQSRLSVLATGDISPAQHLAAYYEMDFLGAGVTSNSRESNSYVPRIRHAYATYDNDDWHFHMLAGQTWSLLTQNTVGITARKENIPLTIDAQYVAGFNWARQAQFRFVGDWNKTAWFGVSVESPEVNFPSNGVFPFSGASAAANVGGANVPTGFTINDLNACQAGGLLNNTTSCATSNLPDVVEKFALDPGWGHYEAVGIQRWFTDRVFTGGVGANNTKLGWGYGGSVLLPLWPKFIDFQASVLTGQGLGRYGSSQLSDVTIGADGSLTPLTTTQFLFGVVAHATPDLDVYAYYGQEQVSANFWTDSAGKFGGYGNPNFVNNGCLLESQAGGNSGFNTAIGGTTCTANVQKVQEFTIGFWKNLYKGPVGRVALGAQYEYVKLDAFPGVATGAGTPNQGLSPNNQIFMASFRYYPF